MHKETCFNRFTCTALKQPNCSLMKLMKFPPCKDYEGHSSYLKPSNLSILILIRFKILSRLWRCQVCRCAGFPLTHVIHSNPEGSRKKKKKKLNEFIISTHMAGTWMSEGITKGLSVCMGMTVAKSQTHTVYTIRFVWFNQWAEHVGGARQWSAMCCTCCREKKAGTVEVQQGLLLVTNTAVSICFTHTCPDVKLCFCPRGTCYCWVWTPHFTPLTGQWSFLPPPSSPFIPDYTSHVSATRGRERERGRDLVDPSQPDPVVTRESSGTVVSLNLEYNNLLPRHFFPIVTLS